MEGDQSTQAREIRTATPADLNFVLHLARQFSNNVGFIPRSAIDEYLDRQAITIAFENGQPAGYLLGNPRLKWQPALRPISQAAIAYDAQRRRHGYALIAKLETEARAAGQAGLQAICRTDLEANLFWQAAGFVKICHLRPDTARKRDLIVWRKPLIKKLPLWFAQPPKRAGWQNLPPTLATRERIPNEHRHHPC